MQQWMSSNLKLTCVDWCRNPNTAKFIPILKQWGFLGDVEAASNRPRDIILRSYSDGKVLSKQNLVPFAEATYSSPYLHIHHVEFHRILVEQAEKLGVEIKLGCMVIGIDFEKPAVLVNG